MATVGISNGALLGSFDNGVHSFKGIPYAEPITGPARWLPPRPRRRWSETRDARRYGQVSLQFASRSLLGPFPTARRRYFEAIGAFLPHEEGDDCLLLNVWSPTLDQNARLPVMVYIHGGSLATGYANELYDGTGIAQANVVCVVIQYRLGPPGFLHTGGLFDGELGGDNRGYLDQLAALQWVQENIDRFGGDARCVTVFGESAGASSVYQLVASPLSKGLFHRAIAMGGNPMTCAPASDLRALAGDALADVGVAAGDAQALAALDGGQLRKLQTALVKRVFGKEAKDRYGQLGQQKIGFMGAATGTEFQPLAPLTAYRQGTPNDVDLMLGTCAADGQLFSLTLPFSQTLSAKMWTRHLGALIPDADAAAIEAFYRQQMPRAGSGKIFEQINNDAFFRMPTIAAAEAHAAGHPGRTYLYQVDYKSAICGLDAVHGIDVALLFGEHSTARGLIGRDDETRRLTQWMRDAFTGFAGSGKPAGNGLPQWAAYEESTRATMVFDRETHSVQDHGGKLRRYWASPGIADHSMSGR